MADMNQNKSTKITMLVIIASAIVGVIYAIAKTIHIIYIL